MSFLSFSPFKGLTPEEFFKEEVIFHLYDKNEDLIASHSFKVRDLEVDTEEIFKEDIIGHNYKIEYTTLISKEEMEPHKILNETTFYEEKSRILQIVDKLVLCIIVNKFTKLPSSSSLEISVKCNNLHQIATVDRSVPYINQVFYV